MEGFSKYVTIPNTLSVSRIFLLPILILLLAFDLRFEFTIAYILIGSTDYFDGKIARRFNMRSEIGKTLDSVADLVFYLGSLGFIYVLYPGIVFNNLIMLYVFFAIFGASFVVSWVRIGKPILMHTSLLRLNAVLVYLLVIVSFFTYDVGSWTLVPDYFAKLILVIYYAAFTEEILIFILFKDFDRDTAWIGELFQKRKAVKRQ
ncbi:MAG: CDP-alcohol phosphatidyltransferase family protein [Candidatus Thermoplasmatota archaeon]|jgi:CDP-diacylglycerol--glycerol-3-phosphate 3-phosphatidyltransferase|nr:CDP-alcohol phosphatidyltransferase family protein [Candidatus Thermoplasmatota archaeon]